MSKDTLVLEEVAIRRDRPLSVNANFNTLACPKEYGLATGSGIAMLLQ